MAAGTDRATGDKPGGGGETVSVGSEGRTCSSPPPTHPSETYADVLVEPRDGGLQVLHGYQHVLDHVVLLVEFPDGLSLSELQQRDLGGNHPSQQPAEQRVVPEGNDVLKNNNKKKPGSALM